MSAETSGDSPARRGPTLQRAAFAFCCLGLSISACRAGEPASGAAPLIEIRNFMFTPATLTVSIGSTVNWTNRDDEPHTVLSEAGLFRSGALDTGQSFSYTFAKPGRYRVWCSIHPQMSGWVQVK